MTLENDPDIKINIINLGTDPGLWILNQYQNVPSIIEWKCPVCGYDNARDCRYESFESPPLGSNFIISLICDNKGCKYVRAVELKISMTLSVENVLPQSIDEVELLKRYFKSSRYAGKTPLSAEDMQAMRTAPRKFLKRYS